MVVEDNVSAAEVAVVAAMATVGESGRGGVNVSLVVVVVIPLSRSLLYAGILLLEVDGGSLGTLCATATTVANR